MSGHAFKRDGYTRMKTRVVAVVVTSLLVGTTVAFSGAPFATADVSSDTPDLSTTVIGSDNRSIALRQWFSATDAGSPTSSSREFAWTAPSTTDVVDVVVFGGGGGGGGGKAGNHGNSTSPNVRGAGGGGGGGGEVRRDSAISVTPGEALSGQAGAGGAAGAGATRGDVNTAPASSGAPGESSLLQRSGGPVLINATGGQGGTGGANSGGGTTSFGGFGGDGGTGGTGGTQLTAGINGVAGSNSTTAPAAAGALDNSGVGWLFNGLRLGLGGGGGGGKSSNGGSTVVISPGTTATTPSVYDLANPTATITRIGGDGDGGNDGYVSDVTKNAPVRLGGGGGGGAFVFSSGRAAGSGGAGGVLLSYVVADLITSELSAADTNIPLSTGSTTITLQLRNAAGTATNVSVGAIEMLVNGTDATLSSVTDNGDGTYTVTLSAGTVAGAATVTANVVGSDFAQTASVTIGTTPPPPTTTSTSTTTTTTPNGLDPSRPIPDSSGQLPQLAPGTGSASLNGVEVPVVVVVEDGVMILRGDGFELRLSGDCGTGCNVITTEDGRQVLVLLEGGGANIASLGFKPGTPVYVWLFSEPTSLGQLTVAEDGTSSGQVSLANIPVGEHTLQVNGTSLDDGVRSMNLGVVVEANATPAAGLPLTGAAMAPLVTAAMALLAFGAGAVAITSRRRRADIASSEV